MPYHCTLCGEKYLEDYPTAIATTGLDKGLEVPMCCNKKLREISQEVYEQILPIPSWAYRSK